MGNQLGCNQICNKTHIADYNPDDILITQYILPCQICNTQHPHPLMKQHLDIAHYATIQQLPNTRLMAQCLLCNVLNKDLPTHAKHIADAHPYLNANKKQKQQQGSEAVDKKSKQQRRVEEWQLNSFKRSAMVQLQSEKEFQIISQVGNNEYLVVLDGISYIMHKYIKQYNTAQYDKTNMQAELLWPNIFSHNKCKYYYLHQQPKPTTILCKCYIFVSNQ